jgi:hypothetical protein
MSIVFAPFFDHSRHFDSTAACHLLVSIKSDLPAGLNTPFALLNCSYPHNAPLFPFNISNFACTAAPDMLCQTPFDRGTG